jgi:hypothetical protein
MQDGGFSATAAAAIFDDCQIICCGLDNVWIEFCNRESNCVAHDLAREAFISSNGPTFILNVLVNYVFFYDQ